MQDPQEMQDLASTVRRWQRRREPLGAFPQQRPARHRTARIVVVTILLTCAVLFSCGGLGWFIFFACCAGVAWLAIR